MGSMFGSDGAIGISDGTVRDNDDKETTMTLETLIDNDALRVFNIQLTEQAGGPVKLEHTNAALIGMEDGTGFAVAANGGTPRFLPMARGRVDWLGDGQLEVHAGQRASVTR